MSTSPRAIFEAAWCQHSQSIYSNYDGDIVGRSLCHIFDDWREHYRLVIRNCDFGFQLLPNLLTLRCKTQKAMQKSAFANVCLNA